MFAVLTYRKVRTAGGQHDLVRLEELALRGQCAIDQSAILQERIKNADQCALVVVPAQTKLLVVVHDFVMEISLYPALA